MQTFSNITQFKINPDVVYTCIDDEAVIMGIQNDELYGANALATKIWQLLESKAMTIPMITRYVLERYDVEEAKCLADINTLLDKLLEDKLISIVDLP